MTSTSNERNDSYDYAGGSIRDALVRAAAQAPAQGFGIFDGRGKNLVRRTYPEILTGVQASAARLAGAGVLPGDRVLVCLPTSWLWIDTWLGAVWLGALPVALAPMGNMAAIETYLRKAEAVVERIGAKLLVADEALRTEAAKHGAKRTAAIVRTPAELEAVTPAAHVTPSDARGEALAFLQLTSGSTGLQRAVMISHRAALHNPLALKTAVQNAVGPSNTVRCIVSWLPLYHDMGLIGCVIYSIAHGLDLWLMRPETFLGRPRLWLEALGAYPHALTPSPNFAYQACVERVDPADLGPINLSSWLGAMTGAEMIRPETCQAFAEKFAGHGFRPNVWRPCYGLAESTLAISLDQRDQGVRTAPLPSGADSGFGLREAVSTGEPILDTTVRIVAPDGSALPDGAIGQVRSKSPSVFSGYYQDPQATAEALQDGWLCTGDLGFLKDGELYITGRTKDLLIVHGHNLMPHELEWLAESVTGGGGTARAAAFSVATGTEGEQAVLVVELESPDPGALAAMEQEIRSRIGRVLGLLLADVAFVRRGTIPKTTSGKIQRGELRQRYLERKIERLERKS